MNIFEVENRKRFAFPAGEQDRNFSSGFALIEILIVMFLFSIIGGLVAFSNIDNFRSYLFYGERDLLVNVLQKARGRAVNNICLGGNCADGKPHGVFFDIPGRRYVIFQGQSYALREPLVDENVSHNFANLAVSGPAANEIVFGQLDGSAAGNFVVDAGDSAGHTVHIVINPEGRIDW